MNLHLVYKEINGGVSINSVADIASVQEDLTKIGKEAFIIRNNQAKEHDLRLGLDIAIHDNKTAWANSVVDFNNITFEEFKSFNHIFLPTNIVYHHWLENIELKVDEFFGAVTDINELGEFSYDLEKARSIHLEVIRREREPFFKDLDNTYMKALQMHDANALETVSEKSRILRDVTSEIKTKKLESIDDLRGKKLSDYLPEHWNLT